MLKQLAILLMLMVSLAGATMSKMYLGSEEGQFILGIESKTENVDGGAGLEIRTYFKKDGIIVNGKEYGSMLPGVKYSFMLAGTNKEGSILRYERDWSYVKDPDDEMIIIENAKNAISTGYGVGTYLLFH